MEDYKTVKNYPILYGLEKNKKTKVWEASILLHESSKKSVSMIKFGQLDGKIQTVLREYEVGKNIGKKNETTHLEQCIIETEKKWKDKKEKEGYKEDIKDNWWIALANNKIGVKIFALIPFIENTQNNKNQHNLRLIATAIKKPEKSSNDNTIISIETDKNISKTQLISAFKELNINAKILKSVEIFQFDSIITWLRLKRFQ
jgi:hypothetical protein